MPEPGFGWNVLEWAWSNRGEILGHLKTVREWFRSEPSRGILVIGPGGVGKSTLARLLSGNFDWLLDEPWRYDESYGVEEYALQDDPKTEIVVPPGQPGRRGSSWTEVERGLASGGYRGVVVVCANGYHTMARWSYKAHPLYQGNKGAFLAAYLQACREDEAAVLERVAAAVRVAPGKVWMMTVVAKEDLWWPARQEAETVYNGGRFAAAVNAVAGARGATAFRHEVVTASLVISNFLSGEGEPLAKNSAGYDHRHQVESLRRPFEALNALREWEARS